MYNEYNTHDIDWLYIYLKSRIFDKKTTIERSFCSNMTF